MIRNHCYYRIKPLVPRQIRFSIRRYFALKRREGARDVWPILPGSQQPPRDWVGWPGGKQFAVVLTHDVEGPDGLAKCQRLAQVEQELGFRSAFSFIPEGPYRVGDTLRGELAADGFEVGIHDLRHDGQLYSSRRGFAKKAARINHYLQEWNAVGFRSGFMLRNLDWLHELNISYDASTFDTDPFEPQPDGAGTIFPFWVPGPGGKQKNEESGDPANLGSKIAQGPRLQSETRSGYVELPYTLPQDSTLFLLLRERTADVWLRKVDWVAQHGGLVLIDTHPDYMAMNGSPPKRLEYPVEMYKCLMRYLQTKYAGAYWQALPKEVATYVRTQRLKSLSKTSGRAFELLSAPKPKPKIWVDLDNTPHVPFFEPIIEELKHRGFPVLVTARDAFQVCALADRKGLEYTKVGRHHGKSRLRKAMGLSYRALQLSALVMRQKPALGVSHGSRSQLLLSNWLRLPTLLLEDYEHARFPFSMRPTWVMAPTSIADEDLSARKDRVRKYQGIKEDVYAWKLNPDERILESLGLSKTDLIVTVRPPATEAHYHNPESEVLFETFMNRACGSPLVKVVLLPRNKKQAEWIRSRWPKWFEAKKTIIPNEALDGLNLIWHSALVVSGGGTMNREAAALGVPVYSIFRGTIGAVDRQLKAEGRLVLIESVAEVESKIALVNRPRKSLAEITSKRTLKEIVDAIQQIAELKG